MLKVIKVVCYGVIHYANSHSGIAIEYELDTHILQEKNIFLYAVKYSNVISNSSKPSLSDYGNSFFTKSRDWEYEKEWRMVALLNNLVNKNKLTKGFKIKSITFGLMTKQKDIIEIKQIFDKKCKYFKMIHSDKINLPFSIAKEAL